MNNWYKFFLELFKKPLMQILLIMVFSVLVSFLYFGENINAKMGIIDDHTYIARGALQNPDVVWNNFRYAPEIMSFGNNSRFRIIYGLFLDLEAWAFGMNASYFYLVNILVFAFFVFSVLYVTFKNFGIKWALPFTLFVIGQSYFAHIFTRLGTAEVWTILGLSVYALGFNSLYHKSQLEKKSTNWKECLAMIIGIILMIGSKENFAVVGVLIVALIVILKQRGKLTKTVVFSSIFMLLLNAYQILHIFLTQRRQGVDLYQNDSGVLTRMMKILGGVFSGDALVLSLSFLFFFVVLGIYLFVESKKGKIKFNDPRPSKFFVQPLFAITILASFFLFNLYIYNGIFHTLHRYAFPSIFVGQILLLTFVKWVYDFRQSYFSKHKFKFLKVAYVVVLVGSMVFMMRGLTYSREISAVNVDATVKFQKKLKKIMKEIKGHPEYPIVFSAHEPVDYEPLISVSFYLKYYGIENKLMIRNNIPLAGEGDAPISRWVTDEITKYEKSGGTNFIPFDENLKSSCYAVDFSGKTSDKKCDNLGKIWRLGSYIY